MLDLVITWQMAREWQSCYSDELLQELHGRDGITPAQALNLAIPPRDILWLLLRPEVFSDTVLRLLSASFIAHSVHLFASSTSIEFTNLIRRKLGEENTETPADISVFHMENRLRRTQPKLESSGRKWPWGDTYSPDIEAGFFMASSLLHYSRPLSSNFVRTVALRAASYVQSLDSVAWHLSHWAEQEREWQLEQVGMAVHASDPVAALRDCIG